MRRGAAVGSLLLLIVVPGTTAALVPWLLTGWDHRGAAPERSDARRRLVLIGVGVAVLLSAFVRFVLEGRDIPAPIAPTERLVVGGLYRYVRNPMYLAVAVTIVGQALLLGRYELPRRTPWTPSEPSDGPRPDRKPD